MGFHFGTNVFALLLFSHTQLFRVALYEGRPMEAAGWTLGEAFALALISIAGAVAALALLLHRRSPMRVSTR